MDETTHVNGDAGGNDRGGQPSRAVPDGRRDSADPPAPPDGPPPPPSAARHPDSDDDPPWPCRGVAEYAYCPRLFYYMTVEGVFVPSADTELGARVHRRVDRPSKGMARLRASAADGEGPGAQDQAPSGADEDEDGDDDRPDDADRPRSVRSLTLSSASLGVTGRLDLAEISGSTAIPVEYRKGRPDRRNRDPEPVDEMMADVQPSLPYDGAQPWPTDRVQVGLQVLLLEEAGYHVPHAVLYYAAERLRLEVPVDDALRAEARRTLEAARRAARGPRPAPLVNDPRCPRCSLQPVCLPDEVNHQRQCAAATAVPADPPAGDLFARTPPSVPAPPRRAMWPPRDDGIHVVLQREGIRVGVRGQSVRVTDRDGATVRDLPLANIESLAVLGGVQVSTQALTVFADHEIPVAFLSAAGRLVAMMDPLGPTSSAVRSAQVRVLDRASRALELARAVVMAKISNQRTLLMRNHADLPARVASELLLALQGAERAATMNELRGHEGNAASIYFRHFAGMFKPGAIEVAQAFSAHGRARRPPPDPINAVLSFGYAMLANECTAACRLASLEPSLGALHTTRPGRPALALDLMEPFRPLIADSVAISAFNRGELTEGHFLRTAAGCALTDAGRRGFFSAYGRRMETVISHPVFEYRLSYRRMLMLHARLIAAWLLGEVPTLAFLTTR